MLPELLSRLCHAGYGRYVLVTGPSQGRPVPGATRLTDSRFEFFTVDFVRGRTCGG